MRRQPSGVKPKSRKITAEDAELIRALYAEGQRHREIAGRLTTRGIAQKFDVDPTTIRNVISHGYNYDK